MSIIINLNLQSQDIEVLEETKVLLTELKELRGNKPGFESPVYRVTEVGPNSLLVIVSKGARDFYINIEFSLSQTYSVSLPFSDFNSALRCVTTMIEHGGRIVVDYDAHDFAEFE